MVYTDPFPKKLSERYNLLSEMRRDTSGIFYRAEDRISGEVLTLKTLYYPQAGPKALENLHSISERLSRLQKSKLLGVVDHGFLRGEGFPYFIATPLLKGQDLSTVIERNKVIAGDTAVKLILLLCRALRWLHLSGLIHCHLRPDCIFIDRDPFQVTLWMDPYCRPREKAFRSKTPKNFSPHYLSPEQIQDMTTLDVQADVYSLGAILYEMVTGQKPYSAPGTPLEIAYRIYRHKALSPQKINPRISQEMENLLSKMMARKPEDRYPSMEELIRDLKKYLNRERLHLRNLPNTFGKEDGAQESILSARCKASISRAKALERNSSLCQVRSRPAPALLKVTKNTPSPGKSSSTFDKVVENKGKASFQNPDLAFFLKLLGEVRDKKKPTALPGTNIIPFPEPVWEKADWSGSPFRNFEDFLKAIMEEYYGG